MRNYLARLGWGHGDDEIFSDEQAIAWFDVVDVVKAPARLDWDKLNHINNHYIRAADDGRLGQMVVEAHRGRGVHIGAAHLPALERAIPLVKEGAKTVLDLADLTLFTLKDRPLALDDKTLGLLSEETRARLDRLTAALSALPEAEGWTVAMLNPLLRNFAETEGVGMGKFGPALRGVLSGGAPAPDLASALAALGRAESLARLGDALSQSQ
jgi:glutamyl-tRNA synthetase